ncbi:MAG: hypothetical protein Q9195_000853 [Heterodermia aff. obscurata]
MAETRAQTVSAASALTTFIESQSESAVGVSHHHALALQVQYDLQYQHDWTAIKVHTHSGTSSSDESLLPRPLLSGLPAHHVYIHPDEQGDILKQGLTEKDVPVEEEWVLPTHIREKWSLRRFAEIFDAIEETPQNREAREGPTERKRYQRTRKRGKRLLMAVVNDDSTIVYYIIHDGIVKPRQN